MKFLIPIFLLVVSACSTTPMVRGKTCATNDASCAAIGGYNLPKVMLGYRIADAEGGIIEITARQQVVSDGFVPLSYTGSNASSDVVSIELDDGFLKSVNASAEDQRERIIAEILNVLKNPLKPLPSGPPGTAVAKEEQPKRVVDVSFDPANTSDVIAAANAIKKVFGLCLSAQKMPIAATKEAVSSSDTIKEKTSDAVKEEKSDAVTEANGIVYRVPAPYRVIVGKADNCSGAQSAIQTPQSDLTFMLPNNGSVVSIPVSRSSWVKRETILTFDKGRLQKVEVKKPSAGLAIARLPATFLRSIIAIPSELIQFKIDTSGREKALTDAQKAELEAQTQLLKAAKDLQDTKDAQNAAANAP